MKPEIVFFFVKSVAFDTYAHVSTKHRHIREKIFSLQKCYVSMVVGTWNRVTDQHRYIVFWQGNHFFAYVSKFRRYIHPKTDSYRFQFKKGAYVSEARVTDVDIYNIYSVICVIV